MELSVLLLNDLLSLKFSQSFEWCRRPRLSVNRKEKDSISQLDMVGLYAVEQRKIGPAFAASAILFSSFGYSFLLVRLSLVVPGLVKNVL